MSSLSRRLLILPIIFGLIWAVGSLAGESDDVVDVRSLVKDIREIKGLSPLSDAE